MSKFVYVLKVGLVHKFVEVEAYVALWSKFSVLQTLHEWPLKVRNEGCEANNRMAIESNQEDKLKVKHLLRDPNLNYILRLAEDEREREKEKTSDRKYQTEKGWTFGGKKTFFVETSVSLLTKSEACCMKLASRHALSVRIC